MYLRMIQKSLKPKKKVVDCGNIRIYNNSKNKYQ